MNEINEVTDIVVGREYIIPEIFSKKCDGIRE